MSTATEDDEEMRWAAALAGEGAPWICGREDVEESELLLRGDE